jgi:gamma-glutamylcyclotransferase (GGCT)/AIG2-like uncharacterized protein YtfP
MHFFTYGTLMFPDVWQAVAGRMFETIGGVAAGYAVYRVADAVYPGMVAAGGDDEVRGVVYLDVEFASLARLDQFEDDFYERRTIWIDCDDGQRRAAEAYVVPPKYRSVLTDEPWDRQSFLSSGRLDYFMRQLQGLGHVPAANE